MQADGTDRHVGEHDGDILVLAKALERLLCAPIEHQRLFEAVLAVEDISQIGVQPCQSLPVPLALEDLSRDLRPIERFLIPAQINERLE